MPTTHKNLLDIKAYVENLKHLMDPQVLQHLADFLAATESNNQSSMLDRYKWFSDKNGEDCYYATKAKEFFELDQAKHAAKAIVWLYHTWAKQYEKGK